jgi:Spy/CpxP family protein refolding chaperone
MKLSKTMFLAALAAAGLFAVGTASAQDATTNAPAAGASTNAAPHSMRRGPDIAKLLNLTDDQKAQVMPIMDAQRSKSRAVMQDDSLSTDDKRAKIKAIRDETNAQLKTILTADQYAKWQQAQARMRRMTTPPANSPAPAPAPAAPPAAPQQ